jgi:hypothetical protein
MKSKLPGLSFSGNGTALAAAQFLISCVAQRTLMASATTYFPEPVSQPRSLSPEGPHKHTSGPQWSPPKTTMLCVAMFASSLSLLVRR